MPNSDLPFPSERYHLGAKSQYPTFAKYWHQLEYDCAALRLGRSSCGQSCTEYSTMVDVVELIVDVAAASELPRPGSGDKPNQCTSHFSFFDSLQEQQ